MVEAEVLFDYEADQDDELTIKKGDIVTQIVQQEGGWWEGLLHGKRGLFPDNFVKVLAKTDSADIKTKSTVTNKEPLPTINSAVNFRKEKKRRCKVLFSYQPVNEDELHLDVDDIIDVLEEVEDGWWRGVLKGKTGVFPSNFVEELPQSGVEKEPSVPPSTLATEEIKPRPIKGVGYGNIFQDRVVKLKPTSMTQPSQEPKVASPKKPPVPVAPTNATDPPHLPPKKSKDLARVLHSYEAEHEDELTLKEGNIITIISKDVEDPGWWMGELNGKIGVFPDNFVEIIVEETKPKKPERPEQAPAPALKTSAKADKDLPDGSALWKESRKDKSESTASTMQDEKSSSLTRGLAGKRLPPDVPKKDEKLDKEKPAPPLPGKKPQLPPPMKKVNRIASGISQPTSNAIRQPSSAMESSNSKPKAHPMKEDSPSNELDFDGVESSSEKLVHLTANRVKNPNRRPPSHDFLKVDNHVVAEEKTNGEVENETPWMKELRKNQAKKNSNLAHEAPNIKNSVKEFEEKQHVPKVNSVKSEMDEKANSRLSSSSSFKKPTPVLSPNKPKPTVTSEGDEVKIDKRPIIESTSPTLPTVVGEPTITELAKLYNILRENVVPKSDYQELKQELIDLRTAFEAFKTLTNRRILELVNDLQEERKCSREELERLRTQKAKK